MTIITLVVIVAVDLALGAFPGVDNFAHIGRFGTGFLLGFVLLIRPHYGWINHTKFKMYQAILWTVSLLLLLAWQVFVYHLTLQDLCLFDQLTLERVLLPLSGSLLD